MYIDSRDLCGFSNIQFENSYEYLWINFNHKLICHCDYPVFDSNLSKSASSVLELMIVHLFLSCFDSNRFKIFKL